MGRSNREQAQQNRERIVEQTGAVIRSGGVAAVSISEIMSRAGMTQGGFYNHFESKDALIAEAVASGFARSARNWRTRAVAAGPPIVGTLRRIVGYYLSKKPPEQSCPMVALGQDAAPHHASPELNKAYREGVDQLFATFVEIAHADTSCILSDDELRIAFAAMVGANMLTRSTGDKKWAAGVEGTLFVEPADCPPP